MNNFLEWTSWLVGVFVEFGGGRKERLLQRAHCRGNCEVMSGVWWRHDNRRSSQSRELFRSANQRRVQKRPSVGNASKWTRNRCFDGFPIKPPLFMNCWKNMISKVDETFSFKWPSLSKSAVKQKSPPRITHILLFRGQCARSSNIKGQMARNCNFPSPLYIVVCCVYTDVDAEFFVVSLICKKNNKKTNEE